MCMLFDNNLVDLSWAQGSILGLVLFNVFINYLHTGIKSTLSKVVNDNKLGGAVDCLKGTEALKGDLDRLESWAVTCMKCRILHL